jgi:deazaflavin-dependent oxidoreductase (nitroreductase family)
MADKLLAFLVRHGKGPGFIRILTVKGRRSGRPHSTPVAPVERDGDVWLVSPFGDVNWVRNLRTVGTVELSRGSEQTSYQARELDAHLSVGVLRTYLSMPSERFVRGEFDITAESTDAEIEAEAPSHPVFALTQAD